MANISSYPSKLPKLGDLFLFSETYDITELNPVIGNPTKSTTLAGIKAAIAPQVVEGTVNTIAMFTGVNTISDGPMTFSADLLNITASTTNTKTLNVANDLTVTRDVLAGRDIVVDRDLKIIGAGVFANIGVTGTATITGAANIVGNASITGTLADSSASVGFNGQVLSSTATGTSWVNLASQTVTSLTTAGVSGSATLTSGVLNIPNYADTQNTLTTTGTGAATLVGTVLNIPTPAASVASPLVWSAQLYQTGTANPSPQAAAVDTLIGTFGTGFRSLIFTRTGVGQYTVEFRYTEPTDTSKSNIMFGDSICRVTSKQDGSGGGVSFRKWNFETPGFDGVLSDGLLLGNNGGYVTITLYP